MSAPMCQCAVGCRFPADGDGVFYTLHDQRPERAVERQRLLDELKAKSYRGGIASGKSRRASSKRVKRAATLAVVPEPLETIEAINSYVAHLAAAAKCGSLPAASIVAGTRVVEQARALLSSRLAEQARAVSELLVELARARETK